MTLEPADQTRGDSTPFLDATGPVALSRNEVSALCLKAARGAGMSWGLAEEAGYAAAWLTEHGIDGPRYLLAHLTEAQRRQWAELCPSVAVGAWHAAPGRSLCPMALGATLCDHVGLPEGPAEGCAIRVGPVDHPVLLIPFLAAVAEQAGMVLHLDWTGGEVAIGGTGAWPRRAADILGGHRLLSFRLTGGAGADGRPATGTAPQIDARTIAGLNALAMRTTVPASAASRAGAGASASDND